MARYIISKTADQQNNHFTSPILPTQSSYTTSKMSYALETKKRKFHRVLESLTKPSAPDQQAKESTTTGAPTTARDAIKKIRLSRDDDTSSTSSIKNSILKVARPGTRASSVSSTARPSFVPWDRERFLERLETFRRVDRWSSKPAAVSEVAWAKRGWICTDVSRVTCVGGCGGSVVVKLPDELDELDGYDADKVQERKDVRMLLSARNWEPMEVLTGCRCKARRGIYKTVGRRTW